MRLGVFLLFACGGCAAGTVPSSTLPPPSSDLTPNYAPALRSLRHWPQPRVAVRLDGMTESQAQKIEYAMHLWNEALLGEVTLIRSSSPEAPIVVRLTSPSMLDGSQGKTTVMADVSTQGLQSALTLLNSDLQDDWLTLIATHELGHALGISGHSPSTDDLMYEAPGPQLAITTRDRNTLLLAYR